jgi:hypothetical protein
MVWGIRAVAQIRKRQKFTPRKWLATELRTLLVVRFVPSTNLLGDLCF